MGVGEEVEIDVVGPIDVMEGDTFVLCSDGLHGLVKEPELKEIARAPLETAAAEYLRRALERGAPDNVTVIVARAEMADAEEEVADGLDETQPLTPIELPPHDDISTRDTERMMPPLTAEELEAGRVAEQPPPANTEREGASDTPRRGSPVVKWTLVVALVLGAAGAYLYWNQSQAVAPVTSRHMR
jgi:hypothetical protein